MKYLLYKNELCNGCQKPLDPATDDLVVCPVCGTPQHRDCWLEHKACVNEARHAQGFVWHGAQAQEDSGGFDPKKDIGNVCGNCGTNNPIDAAICAGCQKSLAGDEQTTAPAQSDAAIQPLATPKIDKTPPFLAGVSESEMIDGVKALDIALYTQLGAKRYLEKFRKFALPGKKLSWSWPAFLFTPYWFFYRKLYWLGGIFLGLTFALSIFFAGPVAEIQKILLAVPLGSATPADILDLQAQLSTYTPVMVGIFATSLITRVAAALTALPSYRKKVMADIVSVRRFAKDENVFRLLVIRRGGTSGLALMGSVLLYDLLWMFVNQMVSQL